MYSLRRGTPQSRERLIQNLLISVYHQTECNARVKDYAERTGTAYEYKMRLRTDMLFLARMPSPRNLDFGTAQRPIVHGATTDILKSAYDKFALGRGAAMDAYLDRYPLLHDVRIASWERMWSSEWFLEEALRLSNASVLPNQAIQATIVRNADFSRKATAQDRTSLANVGRRR